MAILCGPMGSASFIPPRSDHDFPARMKAAVGSDGLTFLSNAQVLWPNLFTNKQFDWSKLRAPAGSEGADRYKAQFWGANINPSDRYVLTEVGTSRYRLAPNSSGFDNLVLAGDWTDYGFNLGCFEGAVISGQLAANAVIGATAAPHAGNTTTQAAGAPIFSGALTVPAVPPFVDTLTALSLPGPIEFRDVTMWAFLLAADPRTLTRFCQSFFDVPTGGRVRFAPLGPWVIMNFSDFAEGRFVGHENRGYSSEREVAFGIPGIYTCSDGGGKVVETGFASFMPYLVVDNPVALVTGREEYGFFKIAGSVGLPGDSKKTPFTVDVFGCKKFARTAKWGPTPLLRLSAAATAGTPPGILRDRRKAAAQLLDAMFVVTPGGSHVTASQKEHFCDLLTGTMSQIFLKQFRDIQDGRRACYQAVALADYRVIKLNSIAPEPGYPMQLTTLDSAPIARNLGLGNPTASSPGMKINLDVRLETGRVLWQA